MDTPWDMAEIEGDLPELNYYFVPIIIVTVSTYFIADVFFNVYAMAVDTLFLCYLEVSSKLLTPLKTVVVLFAPQKLRC